MFGRILPQEFGFFKLFEDISGLTVEAANELIHLTDEGFSESGERRMRAIKALENRADEITHETMTLLHKTFITPIDREDIHVLIKQLDDIMDFIDAAAQRVILYEIKDSPSDLKMLARLASEAAKQVQTVVAKLKDLKNPQDLLKGCIDINRLENEADHALRNAVASLFRDEADIRRLIKLKEIYEILETVTDRCEDVANIIESIVVEYA